MKKNPRKKLFEVAESQQGYFTSQQAVAAGYRINNHPYHVKSGNWIRENRGIYRLANFPTSPDDQFILWSLWSCNRKGKPQGVYSFETALSIYDVSDIMPAKVHMTVPKSFRRNSEMPSVLLLHRDDLQENDYQTIKGFRVTTPLKTVMDVLSSGKLDDKLIQQAISELYERGMLTREDLLQVIEKKPSVAKYFIGRSKLGRDK
jgi:predicted transcriptional regulator of viral defense system